MCNENNCYISLYLYLSTIEKLKKLKTSKVNSCKFTNLIIYEVLNNFANNEYTVEDCVDAADNVNPDYKKMNINLKKLDIEDVKRVRGKYVCISGVNKKKFLDGAVNLYIDSLGDSNE